MTRQSRGNSLTAGIVLLALGIVFTLHLWYRDFSVWRLLSRYWPLIVIAIGLTKLYRYFTWEKAGPMPPPAVPGAPVEVPPLPTADR